MTTSSNAFLKLELSVDIFKEVKYFVSGEVHEKILDILKSGGAERINYFSDYVTHLIVGDNPEENDIVDAIDVYEIPAVSPKWVIICTGLRKLVDTKPYLYTPDGNLFSNLVFCFSGIKEDLNFLWALITFNGGVVQLNLTKRCNYLVTTGTESTKFGKAENLGPDIIKIVTPDWVVEAVKSKSLIDHSSFHPRLIDWPKPIKHESTTAITGFEPEQVVQEEDSEEKVVSDTKQTLLAKLKQRMPWNQPVSSSDPVGPPNVVAPSYQPLRIQPPQTTNAALANQKPPNSVVHHPPNPQTNFQQQANTMNLSRLVGQQQVGQQQVGQQQVRSSLQQMRGQIEQSQLHQQLMQQQRPASQQQFLQQQLAQRQLQQRQLINQQQQLQQQQQQQVGANQSQIIQEQHNMTASSHLAQLSQQQLLQQQLKQNQQMQMPQNQHQLQLNQNTQAQMNQNQQIQMTQNQQIQMTQSQLQSQTTQNQQIQINQSQLQNQLQSPVSQNQQMQMNQSQLQSQATQNQQIQMNQSQLQSQATQIHQSQLQSQATQNQQIQINQSQLQSQATQNQQIQMNQSQLQSQAAQNAQLHMNTNQQQIQIGQNHQPMAVTQNKLQSVQGNQNQQIIQQVQTSQNQHIHSQNQLIQQAQQTQQQTQQIQQHQQIHLNQNQHMQLQNQQIQNQQVQNQPQILQNQVIQTGNQQPSQLNQQQSPQHIQMSQGQSFLQQNINQHLIAQTNSQLSQQKQQFLNQQQVVTSHQQINNQPNLTVQQQQQQQQFVPPFSQNDDLNQRGLNQQSVNPQNLNVHALNQQLSTQNLGQQLNQQQLNQQLNQQTQMSQASNQLSQQLQQGGQLDQLNIGQLNLQMSQQNQMNQQITSQAQLGQQSMDQGLQALNQQLNQGISQLQQQQINRQSLQQQQLGQQHLQLQQQQGHNQANLQQLNQMNQQVNQSLPQQIVRTQFQQPGSMGQQILINQPSQQSQAAPRQQLNQHLWSQQQTPQMPGQQIIRHPVNVIQQGAPRVQWSPNGQQGGGAAPPQRQYIQLDARTHQELQKMPPEQQAIFVAKIQRHRQFLKQVQQRGGGGSHILIRGNVPPGLTTQQQVQWLQQQAKQQGIVLPPNIQQQNITPGTLVAPPAPPATPGLSPINQGGGGGAFAADQQVHVRQFRLQHLQLQREQAQKNLLAQQQGALAPPMTGARPPAPADLPPPAMALAMPVSAQEAAAQAQLQHSLVVNAKTKTALANMLSIKLQSGGSSVGAAGGGARIDGLPEPSASGTLRMMTAQHNAALNSKPQEIMALQQRRAVAGPPGSNGIADALKQHPGAGAPPLPPTPARESPKLLGGPKAAVPLQHRPGPFYGHNPNLKLPPELFLLGCIFVVVEVDKFLEESIPGWQQRIEKHGGEVEKQYCGRATHVVCETQRHGVVMQALRDCKRCVTVLWLNDVIARRQVLPPWTALHLPAVYWDAAPAGRHLMSISGFEARDRWRVKEMVKLAGGKCTSYFSKHNTILISTKGDGKKVAYAKKWQIPVVNVQWLTDVMLGHFAAMNQTDHQMYQQFQTPPNFSFDPKLVPNLMVAWKAPINISQESYERVKRCASPVVIPKKPKKQKVETTDENDNINDEQATNPAYRVLFSMFADAKELHKIVRDLGGSVAKTEQDLTHLVMPRLARTTKLFFALAKAAHLVSAQWLYASRDARRFLPESDYPLEAEQASEDAEQFGRPLGPPSSRARLFEGKFFFVTPSVFPSRRSVGELIKCCGGVVERKRRSAAQIEATAVNSPYSYFIVTHEDDLHLVGDLLRNKKDKVGIVCNAELVFSAVVKEVFEVEPYAVCVL